MMNLPTRNLCAIYIALLCIAPVFAGEPEFKNAGLLNMPETIGKLPKVVRESSGLIKSKRHADKGVFWTHNDSGDTARIFAVDLKGALLRIVDIPGATNVDWEEITMDDKGRLIICDCGDNNRNNNDGRREGVVLYRLPEPDAFNANEKINPPQVFRFHYPDGKKIHDAEGAFWNGGNVYLFSKQNDGASCYELAMPEHPLESSVPMVRVGKTESLSVITGAALSADGKRLAIINYLTVLTVEFPDGFKPSEIFTAPRKSVNCVLGQTEGVAWDGDDLIITSEGRGIFRLKK